MIDLRSDTVTLPTEEMKAHMFEAPVGDDVYGEDPTVNQLEQTVAELCGKQNALFAPSGTQSNLLALMSHCARGDEYIAGQDAHTYKYEGGGAAVLGSIQPQPLEFERNGVIPLDKIRAAIKSKDDHFANTALICLENTMAGQCLPSEYVLGVRQLSDQHGLKMHLDGARLFNAHIATGHSICELTSHFDSISLCMSKGLGAPAGSLLIGSHSLIQQARRWRKVLGGGMRQVGILAAGCIYALDNNIERLNDDHIRAKTLTQALSQIAGLKVLDHSGITNMVFVDIPPAKCETLKAEAFNRGINLPSGINLRLVTHMNISDNDIEKVIQLFNDVLG